jgi:hypothetical protein
MGVFSDGDVDRHSWGCICHDRNQGEVSVRSRDGGESWIESVTLGYVIVR